ncbi:MAG: alpha-1,2-fucosyltransferase [Chlamydiota bacterium]
MRLTLQGRRLWRTLSVCSLLYTCSLSSTVILRFQGQFGNQLFQIAAAVALAQENQCPVYFPDFEDVLAGHLRECGIDRNYRMLFHKIPEIVNYGYATPNCYYNEPDFAYHPIPYCPNITINGYFQSEKHFGKYRDLILKLFAAPQEIEEALQKDYSTLIEHPNSVGIHVRTFCNDFKSYGYDYRFYQAFLPPDIEYYRQAIEMFDPESLFVVFSDNIAWCKKHFAELNRNFLFVDGNDYLYDFFLLSKCKNVIVGSSTFSWWAAYLNTNPNKKVIIRQPFLQSNKDDPQDIVCEGWIPIHMPQLPPFPVFD